MQASLTEHDVNVNIRVIPHAGDIQTLDYTFILHDITPSYPAALIHGESQSSTFSLSCQA